MVRELGRDLWRSDLLIKDINRRKLCNLVILYLIIIFLFFTNILVIYFKFHFKWNSLDINILILNSFLINFSKYYSLPKECSIVISLCLDDLLIIVIKIKGVNSVNYSWDIMRPSEWMVYFVSLERLHRWVVEDVEI